MKQKVGLFYGSTTGNTERVAQLIVDNLGEERIDVIDIAADGVASMADYQKLILGIPTWDFGELQEDWEELWELIHHHDFKGVSCALFGLGDQIGYGEWFLDAMGLLHDQMQKQGAILVGYWSVEGYDFEASKALTEDGKQFVGLAIDEDCQAGETEQRVKDWCKQLEDELFQ